MFRRYSYTETCRSCFDINFNVNFNIVFLRKLTSASVGNSDISYICIFAQNFNISQATNQSLYKGKIR